MKPTVHRERGVTMISFTLWVAAAIIFFTMAVKLFPPYYEAYQIQVSIDTVASEANRNRISPIEIRDKIYKRFQINNVYNVDRQDIKIRREGYRYLINVNYVVQIPFILNMELLIYFSNHAEVLAS